MNCALVLLPGMDGTGELFAPLVEALGSAVHTIVVRYPDEPLSYAQHEAFARSRLPKDRPYVVLGESFSGPIAIRIAASAPREMRGYILAASFVRCPQPLLRPLKPFLRLLPLRQVPTAVAAYFLMGRFGSAGLRRAHSQTLQRVSPAALTARLKGIAEIDVCDEAQRARIPVLYLRATHDRLVGAGAARLFARHAAHARVVAIEGPHFLLQTQPAEAAHRILGFMRDLEVTG